MRNLTILIAIAAIAVLGGIALWSTLAERSENIANEVQTVRSVVTDFGSQLTNVSLLAPDEVVREQIRAAYARFVSDELLAAWLEKPAAAPGRLTSSPWPDRIEIANIRKTDRTYTVVGSIVMMTSAELTSSADDNAGQRSVTVTVANVGGDWVITAFQLQDAKTTDRDVHLSRKSDRG